MDFQTIYPGGSGNSHSESGSGLTAQTGGAFHRSAREDKTPMIRRSTPLTSGPE